MLFDNERFESGRLPAAHWSEDSQQYATGEVLHALLNEGMHICGVVFLQQKPLAGGRNARIYLVTLQRHDSPPKRLALVENPYVTRLLKDCGAQIIRLNWRKDATVRAR
jgi:hypothetical protein